MLKTTTSIANIVSHLVEIKHKVLTNRDDPQSSFIDLCDSSNEDGMLTISLYPLNFSLQMSYFLSAFVDSPYSSTNIPFVGGPFVLSVVDYFRAMSSVAHVSFELRYLNYDNFHIVIIPCILTTFNGDVLFELLPLLIPMVILVKCKELTRNMMAMHGTRLKRITSKTISTSIFEKLAAWAICNVEMMHAISFFLTNVKMKQFGMVTLFMSFKEIVLHMVHLFAKPIILPPYV
jgi:hypothetical protein